MSLGLCYGTGYGSRRSSSVSTANGAANTKYAANSSVLSRVSSDIACGYSSDLGMINNYIERGDIDKAVEEYNNLLNEVRPTLDDYQYSFSDGQIESIVSNAYKNMTGQDITTSISNNTNGTFATGLAEGIPVIGLFFQNNSEAEALDKIKGDKTSSKEEALELAGKITGAAAGGAAIGGVIGGVIGAIGGTIALPGLGSATGASAGAILGAKAGAVIGTAVGFVQDVIRGFFNF